MIKRTILLSGMAAFMLGFSACNNSDENNNSGNCPSAVLARWKVNGDAYESSTILTYKLTNSFVITMVACVSDNVDKAVNISIPHALQPGTYVINAAGPEPEGGVAYYSVEEDGDIPEQSYSTDPSHTGSITITEMADGKYSATFYVTVVNNDGPETLSITDGEITDANYPQ